ncbi:hypothetical protein [Amycolatopsis sp. lyj-109]|uniref:hypothetical protein n=1 Tax=Amycolatopsis sp. lyj-109 TaxID=2789287 RepID=UPI003978BD23
MNTVELAAIREIPTHSGVLHPLQMADRLAPVSCLAAAHAAVTDALLTVQLARQATATPAAAHWAGQVNRVLGQVATHAGGFDAPGGNAAAGLSAQAANMSVAELTMLHGIS